MAKDKKSFILYCDQKGVWDKLDDAQAGKLIKHIIAYVNDEKTSKKFPEQRAEIDSKVLEYMLA